MHMDIRITLPFFFSAATAKAGQGWRDPAASPPLPLGTDPRSGAGPAARLAAHQHWVPPVAPTGLDFAAATAFLQRCGAELEEFTVEIRQGKIRRSLARLKSVRQQPS